MLGIHNYALGNYKKAMVWIGARPSMVVFNSSLTVFRSPAEVSQIGKSRYTALELNIPSGPMVKYALIGGNRTFDGSNILEVRISCVGDSGVPFLSEIATERSAIFGGIPEEYIDSIKEKIDSIKKPIKGGELHIDIGAHSIYGSSPDMFGLTAGVFMDLFHIEDDVDLQSFLSARLDKSKQE